MSTIEIIGKSQIRIGERIYRLFTLEKPIGWIGLSVETYGDPHPFTANVQDKFSLSDLGGVLASDIPNNLSFSAYDPRLDTPQIESLYIENIQGRKTFSCALSHSHQDWNWQESLPAYSERLAIRLRESIPGCLSCKLDRDEYGITLNVETALTDNTDLEQYIRAVDGLVFKALSELKSITASTPASTLNLKPDERGPKCG